MPTDIQKVLFAKPDGRGEGDHSASEALNLFVLFHQAPVELAHRVILAVRIIVAPLGSAKLVSAEQHGDPHLKTAINDQPGKNRVRKCPQRRSDPRCRLVESGLTIESPCEL